MCGIAGLFDATGAPPDRHLVAAMSARIVHRGPDEDGFLWRPGAGLASRRLRIIDLEGGRQPIFNEDGSVGVVFNGEIYNFQELRADLIRGGHRFTTQSDTEVLVHLYEDRGLDFLQPLRGMFALALWDDARKIGVLARDRLGKKPLLYAQLGPRLHFASEMQALMPVPGLSREVDPVALGEYLEYGYVPAPRTIFRDVRKLPPAHMLVWQDAAASPRRWWELRYEPKLPLIEGEALEALERELDEAVRLRLIADVPVGALLSGGVDSSVVVALMARHSARVKTFSIGFDEPAFDELVHARRVAERYGTDHHELVVKPDAAEVLPLLVRHYGEPYADSSAVPTFYVSQLARRHVTVALNGDGGDEDFAGYDRYRAAALAGSLARFPGAAALAPAAAALLRRLPSTRRAAGFLDGIGQPLERRYGRWASLLVPDEAQRLLARDVAAAWQAGRAALVETQLAQHAALALTDRLLATDVAGYLPFDLLVKMDIATMANSLEVRSPLLDHRVMELAARLPDQLKLKAGRQQKYLLKQLARKLIPPENIDRPKMGFGMPAGAWLRGPLRDMAHEALHDGARQRGFLDPAGVQAMWAEHQSGRRDRTHVLWSLLMFELWCREFLDGPAPAAAQPSPALASSGTP